MRLVITVFIAGLGCLNAFGQAADGPAFEVATVKSQGDKGQPTQGIRGGPGTASPEQITAGFSTLVEFLEKAYDIRFDRIRGPAWIEQERYDISAKVPAGATAAQVSQMWQRLLAERFGVRVHREPKEFSVLELLVAETGPKLKTTALDPATMVQGATARDKDGRLMLAGAGLLNMNTPTASGYATHITANGRTMAQFIAPLTTLMAKPVLDKTGLTGFYDFVLDFNRSYNDASVNPRSIPPPEMRATLPDPAGPDLETALRQQLGLKLVPAKTMLDVLVVDQAEKVPTSN